MSSIEELVKDLGKKEIGHNRGTISFLEFAQHAREQPERAMRNIFQYLNDVVYHYLEKKKGEYDPDTLFVEGIDKPFFTDNIFLEQFLTSFVHNLSRGQENRFFVLDGDPGSGKSRFVNVILSRAEQYSQVPEGVRYETLWRLQHQGAEPIDIPCPHHDSPFLAIPRNIRKGFIEKLIGDHAKSKSLLSKAGYSWLLSQEPCSICESISSALQHKGHDLTSIMGMVWAKPYVLNRKLSQGISVYNPGDDVKIDDVIKNEQLENKLNEFFGGSPKINYYYSRLAQTNNGILLLMDLQGANAQRLAKLHSIISDETHRAIDLEEHTKAAFFITRNPRMKNDSNKDLEFTEEKAFKDRAIAFPVKYLLNHKREFDLYHSQYGKDLRHGILPGIIEAFAKTIVSSRINNMRSDAVHGIIGSVADKYKMYSDPNYVLLRMEIFAGSLPSWMSEDDKKRFTKEKIKEIVEEFPEDGTKGISGRDANHYLMTLLNERNRILQKDAHTPMGMTTLVRFIRENMKNTLLKSEFVDALEQSYHYDILQQVNQSLFYLNEENVVADIADYLVALPREGEEPIESPYTQRLIRPSQEFLGEIERKLDIPQENSKSRREILRKTLARIYQENGTMGFTELCEQQLFKDLKDTYMHTIRTNTLKSYHALDTLREAVNDLETGNFQTYEERVRKDVSRMLGNLMRKHEYSKHGAQQIVLYTIDNKLHEKFYKK